MPTLGSSSLIKSSLCALVWASASLTFACAKDGTQSEPADAPAAAGAGGASAGAASHPSTGGHANAASSGGTHSGATNGGQQAGAPSDTSGDPGEQATGGGPGANDASGGDGSNPHGPSSGKPSNGASGGTPSDPGEASGGTSSDPGEASGGVPSDPDGASAGSGGASALLPASCEEVIFDDPALESELKLTAGVTSGSISPDLARRQTTLYAVGERIHSLKGLECFPNLTRIDLGKNDISVLDPLSHLTRLTYLDLSGNEISDLGPLRDRDELEVLKLSGNKLTDLSPLAKLTGLTTLGLSQNSVSDIGIIANLTALRVLSLDRNPGLEDTSPLESLTRLEELDVDGIEVDPAVLDDKPGLSILNLADTGISNIDFLAHCPDLRQVVLAGDPVSDISALEKLSKLEHVDLDRTNVRDLTPLANNPGIGKGDTVFEQTMSWDDCEAQLSSIQAMIDRGATVLVQCAP